MTELAIQLENVSKTYRRGVSQTNVLTGVELQVRKGECAFLAGPSGSGKSTLLSIVGAMLSADSGTSRVLGREISLDRANALSVFRLRQIGFVFQRFQLIRGLNALDNVCVPMTLLGISRGKAQSRASQLLDTLGMGDKLTANPNNLSMGQCQRVAIARALANDPQLILADEPTASLDAENGRLVVEILRDLTKQQNRTVVVVTHDSRIFPYADCVHWLQNGRITESKSLTNIVPLDATDSQVWNLALNQ